MLPSQKFNASKRTQRTYNQEPQCQKCLQLGHWTYQCKGRPTYQSRPVRSKPSADVLPPLMAPKVPEEFLPRSQRRRQGRSRSPSRSRRYRDRKRPRRSSSTSSSSSSSSSSMHRRARTRLIQIRHLLLVARRLTRPAPVRAHCPMKNVIGVVGRPCHLPPAEAVARIVVAVQDIPNDDTGVELAIRVLALALGLMICPRHDPLLVQSLHVVTALLVNTSAALGPILDHVVALEPHPIAILVVQRGQTHDPRGITNGEQSLQEYPPGKCLQAILILKEIQDIRMILMVDAMAQIVNANRYTLTNNYVN
ncbi:hypothetical protein IWQ61_002823 [Dispira simplex]|nr:hypothetical protein IWQ61_002823 [Dispira simplex]